MCIRDRCDDHYQLCVVLDAAEHIEDIRPWFGPGTYHAISIGLIILLVVGILAVVGGVAFIKSQEKSRKRFF